MQKPLVPNSLKHLINDDGSVSRQLQLLLSALVANSVPIGQDSGGTSVAGAVLLPNTASVPQGWTQIDTLVIGANTYKVISMV
jgi:hypothetical protein